MGDKLNKKPKIKIKDRTVDHLFVKSLTFLIYLRSHRYDTVVDTGSTFSLIQEDLEVQSEAEVHVGL